MQSKNASLVSECVLLYTFSHLHTSVGKADIASSADPIANVINYLDHNYTDPTLNLKKAADIFGYTDKYLSHLFKSRMNINWTTYLNNLRIHHAIGLIDKGMHEPKHLFEACGFGDQTYFSKVFKKLTGKTLHVYIQEKQHH